jgi:hypothetical protein
MSVIVAAGNGTSQSGSATTGAIIVPAMLTNSDLQSLVVVDEPEEASHPSTVDLSQSAVGFEAS